MDVVVEALCAGFGGIRTYVEHLLRTWPEVEPDDRLIVLVEKGSDLPVPDQYERVEVPILRPVQAGRPWAQTRAVRWAVRATSATAVLATLPSTTLNHPGVRTAVVHYDLRHELRPEQFSRARRMLRRISYGRGYGLADAIISISQRSLDDLYRLHPRLRATPGYVVHLGADHVLEWPQPPARAGAIAFAHHTNKNPDLVLDAYQHLTHDGVDLPPLTLLGVGSDRRESMANALAERGLTDVVSVSPFLDDAAFAATFAGSRLVVFPTDFEGFGLPVVEAMALGIPVVIGPERATQEVAGGHAFVAADWTAPALATQIAAALDASPAHLDRAREHAERFTWRRVVEQTRRVLAEPH